MADTHISASWHVSERSHRPSTDKGQPGELFTHSHMHNLHHRRSLLKTRTTAHKSYHLRGGDAVQQRRYAHQSFVWIPWRLPPAPFKVLFQRYRQPITQARRKLPAKQARQTAHLPPEYPSRTATGTIATALALAVAVVARFRGDQEKIRSLGGNYRNTSARCV